MEIHEDKELFSGDEEKITVSDEKVKKEKETEEKAPILEEKKLSPGTRIIYEAPEIGVKREYTGFVTDNFDENDTVISDDFSIKEEYKAGHEFETELKIKNAYPKKRPVPPVKNTKETDEKELLRKRYSEYKKSGKLPHSEDVDIDDPDELDIEDISIDYIKKAKKKLSTGEIIRRSVLAVAVVAILISSGVLINQYMQYKKNQNIVDNLNGLIITDSDDESKPENDDKQDEEETTTRPLTVEEQWAQLKADYPNVVFPTGIQLKYAKFYAINQDFVGFLSIDALDINLPVLQSKKEEYYLRRNIYKENSKYGTPFVPSDNDMVNLDRNTVIYGHNMSDGSMFAPLNTYKKLDGYKSAPVIQFDTVYGSYKWKVFAAFITNASASDDNGYIFPYYFTSLESDTEFMKYIELLKERSLYDTGVDVISTDKILTLSTCAYNFDNARFVVVARLVRNGESEEVDTSQAKTNKNPHYPQAWYGKKKKDKEKNPFIDAEKWYYNG